MAASLQPPLSEQQNEEREETDSETQKLYSTYLGMSFAVFLSLLPKNTVSLLPTLQSRNHCLLHRLRKAEEELSQMRSRRQEDSKANARVVEIFATHRNAWQQEERRLLRRLDESAEEISSLRSRLAELDAHEDQLLAEAENLRREVGERDELLDFMSRHKTHEVGGESVESESGGFASVSGEERNWGGEDEGGGGGGGGGVSLMFGHLGSDYNDGFHPNYLPPGSKFWGESRPPNLWQVWINYPSLSPFNLLFFTFLAEFIDVG